MTRVTAKVDAAADAYGPEEAAKLVRVKPPSGGGFGAENACREDWWAYPYPREGSRKITKR